MTIKQFIEEAHNIGHGGAYISAEAEGHYLRHAGRFEIIYKIWCSTCDKHTHDTNNPNDALTEFRLMHGVTLESQEEDMVLTEETHEN